jgi:hypothetical protein
MFVRWHPFFSTGEAGGTGSDPDNDQGGKVKPSDVLARYGQTAESALRMAEKLAESENANWQLREKNRTLRHERDDARGKVPAEGGTVLSKDEAAAWATYQALGKPDEVKRTLEASTTAQQELTGLRRAETIRTVAEAHGYKAPVLAKLPSLAGKELVLKDVTEEGKQVKRAFVGDQPLVDYIQANDAEFMPALTAEAQQQQSGGTSYVAQSAGGKPPATNAGKAHIQTTKYAVPGKTT